MLIIGSNLSAIAKTNIIQYLRVEMRTKPIKILK